MDQKQELERHIHIIRNWDGKDDTSPFEIENTFIGLDELDKNKNIELWQQLLQALQENTALHKKPVQQYLRRLDLSDKGKNWWWNPRYWRAKSA